MKKILLFGGCMSLATQLIAGNPAKNDSARSQILQCAQVVATRANAKTPMAFTNISKKKLKAVNFGRDIPYLLATSPSVVTSSDAGTGIGYTGIRVRGTDPSRINVTVNGIPLNDAESNAVYWVNMGDFASNLNSVQIQRGVGTSTNGSGAFGASVNMQTDNLGGKAYSKVDLSGGSYGTHKETFSFGSGLLRNHWAFNGRLSNIGSDGYIKRASAKLNSYFLQGGYMDDNTVVKFVTFNGTERTYHAWNYASEEQMKEFGRDYNPCGEYKNDEGKTVYYKGQTDNYHQQHYQLLMNQRLSRRLNFNAALHYTHGYGYYEQYKSGQKLYKYLLVSSLGAKSDMIRRKFLDNDFYGTVFSLNYKKRGLDASVGGGWNLYDGDHYGQVTWLKDFDGKNEPDHEYYRNRGKKKDGNIYGKVTYRAMRGLTLYADLQYRRVDYDITGPSEKFNGQKMQIPYDIHARFNFFNPKAGVFWRINRNHTVYGSFAMAHKEPTRDDYKNTIGAEAPRSERLNDFEWGYKFKSPVFSAGANFYYMLYKDQFVLTGEQNEIGEMIAKNVGKSYRRGIELTAAWKPCSSFRWDANATFSQNRAENMEVQLDNTGKPFNLGNTPLTFSPSIIANNIFTAKYRGFTASLRTQYVGEQYMSNTGLRSYKEGKKDVSLMLKAYCVSDFDLSYTFKHVKFAKNVTLGVSVYNLFNAKYENNGAAGVIVNSDGKGGVIGVQDDDYDSYSVYSAQAPANVLAHLSVSF